MSDPASADDLWSLIEARTLATPDALFSIDERGRRLSFSDYRDAALSAAAGLAARGIEADTSVSWMLPTWTDALVLMAALARLGARQNPILPIYRGRELRFIGEQSGARLLVVPRRFRDFDYEQMARDVAADTPGLEVLVVDAEAAGDEMALPAGDPRTLPPAPGSQPSSEAPVRWLFYTSGTTADPKGALHSDRTLLAASRGLADVVGLQADDRVALVFPVTHIGGANWLMAGLCAGAALLVVPVFDPDTSIPFLAAHGVTQATAGTAFHQAYLEAQRARPDAPLFPAVRCFPGGGAPKPPQLHRDLKRELGGAGIVSGYGMTECPIIAMNRITDPDEKLAHTEGRANPASMKIRVVAPDGRLAGPNKEGEIRARGPQLFAGYLDASLDAAALDEQGYMRTGDLGRVDDDGFVTITGRLKDVIIRKGENISAKEIEDILHQHPKVAEVAAVGLPDPRTGERCCAVVACRDPAAPLEFEEMVAFLKQRELMTQKIPEQLELVDVLPRNPMGKVLKQALRDRLSDAALR